MACQLTTADFANQQKYGPFLDATWKCRVPECGKLPGQHPVPATQQGIDIRIAVKDIYNEMAKEIKRRTKSYSKAL
eukprot:CAMPEP_0170073828 /NCGR_PEP_ID=MMETSP0019_2-20121128/11205_1 /TAXON_ID=98059 /ORGANISM="Dinobryon sp., Strain UTEXLB2267" /LENGTH=75 /DNA_ID=CAMNT_0010283667 /DNA_START=1 /DNA_END=228 /DNA_ORIENTATION=-